jgi:hypothetical protein
MAQLTLLVSIEGDAVPVGVIPASVAFPAQGGSLSTPPLQFTNAAGQVIPGVSIQSATSTDPSKVGVSVNGAGGLDLTANANGGASAISVPVTIVTV